MGPEQAPTTAALAASLLEDQPEQLLLTELQSERVQ
jgi:hypothetical protein